MSLLWWMILGLAMVLVAALGGFATIFVCHWLDGVLGKRK